MTIISDKVAVLVIQNIQADTAGDSFSKRGVQPPFALLEGVGVFMRGTRNDRAFYQLISLAYR